jgi:cyclophilin family peptidyl-prolyl cis-trans isomerase
MTQATLCALRQAFAISLLCAAAALAACGGGKKESKAATNQPVTAASSQASGCKRVSPPTPKGEGHEKKPKGKLDPAKKWSLVIETNCGSFTVALDPKEAPKTTASLVSLAKSKFFDDTTFHRIVPGFVIQGGDPTGTGQGGPGYKTVDKPPAGAGYIRGVVAMAKTQAEPAGTAGSQFFVVTGQDTGLPAEYAVVGHVSQGLDVVARIGQLGDPATESPKQPVVIAHVTVKHD